MRRELDALQSEIASVRQQNDALSRRVDTLGLRLDALASQKSRPASPAPTAAEAVREPGAPLVPPDLAVVHMAPPKAARAPPPLSTAVPMAEPDPDRLEALAQPTGREIAAEAEGELAAARRKGGVDRARAREGFVARYPRHPSADNALVEAARAHIEVGRAQAGCELAARVPQDYPAGDAVSGANEIVARCERSRP